MKVKYIGKDLVALKNGKIYDVISVEKGWYRIMTELDEDYLFPPESFEIIDIVMLVGSAAILWLVARTGHKITRFEGAAMLIMFLIYYGFIIYGALA